jgi:hypothetical protein
MLHECVAIYWLGCGEGGIRTLGREIPYNGLAGRPVQPLRHLSLL